MKKQTMDQDFKTRLVISLATAGYYNSPLAKAIMAVDAKIKSIPADKAGKMMFGVTFDKNLLIAKQYDFLDSFIENVVPHCQDVTMLKNMLGELVDVFMCAHGTDDFVQLEHLLMLGDVRVPPAYPKAVAMLLDALRRPDRPVNPHQCESIISILNATRYGQFPSTLMVVVSDFLRHDVNMTPNEIMNVLQTLAKQMLRNLKHEHTPPETHDDAPSEINVYIRINPQPHQSSADSSSAFPLPGQDDKTDAGSRVSKPTCNRNTHADNENVPGQRPVTSDWPTRQTKVEIAGNFALNHIDRLLDAIAKGHKPSDIGNAAVVISKMLGNDRRQRAVEVIRGHADYQSFDDARRRKEESLYQRFISESGCADISELVTEIVLFAPMMFSPDRFIERLAYIEMRSANAKHLR